MIGWDQFSAAIDRVIGEADEAARKTVEEGAALLEAAAKANFEGTHAKGQRHVGGDKPNVVSGTLRRSVHGERARRLGMGEWGTRVGPSAVYGRRVELEYGYAFFTPAARDNQARFREIAIKHWRAAILSG